MKTVSFVISSMNSSHSSGYYSQSASQAWPAASTPRVQSCKHPQRQPPAPSTAAKCSRWRSAAASWTWSDSARTRSSQPTSPRCPTAGADRAARKTRSRTRQRCSDVSGHSWPAASANRCPARSSWESWGAYGPGTYPRRPTSASGSWRRRRPCDPRAVESRRCTPGSRAAGRRIRVGAGGHCECGRTWSFRRWRVELNWRVEWRSNEKLEIPGFTWRFLKRDNRVEVCHLSKGWRGICPKRPFTSGHVCKRIAMVLILILLPEALCFNLALEYV